MALAPFDDPRVDLRTEWAGREVILVAGSVVELDPPLDVEAALVQVQDDVVRMTADGSDPSATSGVRWTAGDWFRVTGRGDIKDLKFVREGAANGTLEVNYYVRVD